MAGALLLIFAGLVFAAGLRAAEMQLGRVWKVHHGIRLTVVILVFFSLLIGFFAFAGLTLTAQAQALAATVQLQLTNLAKLAQDYGVTGGSDPVAALTTLLQDHLDQFAIYVGSAVGALGSMLLIITIGIYVAAEPRLYERGVEWLTPANTRPGVHSTLVEMSRVLRRWVAGRVLTMGIEGTFIFIGLSIIGVPLAGLLALVSGLLAFIPNLGAIISGALIIAVGFSVGQTEGLWAIGVYAFVQLFEGNVLNPLIEKRAVDRAPAVVLGAQLLFGVLFGILGVALADPIVALAKVALQRRTDTEPEGSEVR